MLYVKAIAYVSEPPHKLQMKRPLPSSYRGLWRTILLSDSFHTFNDAMHAATDYATVKDVTHVEIVNDNEVLAEIRADTYRRYMRSTA